jgi:hypothetical protein
MQEIPESVQATVNSIHGELRTKSSSRGAQVWTAERRAQASLKSKERIAAKKISAGGRKRGESERTSNSVLINVLVFCYQMLPNAPRRRLAAFANLLICKVLFGGPDRDRTDDLFHAISATSRNALKPDGTDHTLRH